MGGQSFSHVPDWSRGCIRGDQAAVKPETGFRNLGFQCASPGFRDSPAEPTDHCQGLLESFNPQNWTTQVSRDLPLSFLHNMGSDRVDSSQPKHTLIRLARETSLCIPEPQTATKSHVEIYFSAVLPECQIRRSRRRHVSISDGRTGKVVGCVP